MFTVASDGESEIGMMPYLLPRLIGFGEYVASFPPGPPSRPKSFVLHDNLRVDSLLPSTRGFKYSATKPAMTGSSYTRHQDLDGFDA